MRVYKGSLTGMHINERPIHLTTAFGEKGCCQPDFFPESAPKPVCQKKVYRPQTFLRNGPKSGFGEKVLARTKTFLGNRLSGRFGKRSYWHRNFLALAPFPGKPSVKSSNGFATVPGNRGFMRVYSPPLSHKQFKVDEIRSSIENLNESHFHLTALVWRAQP